MNCCNEQMWKYERMAMAFLSEEVPEFIWYCDNCHRIVIGETDGKSE